MSAIINCREYRLEAELVGGKAHRVVIATGNKKKGTKAVFAVTEPIYTLAQAQCFISNNYAADFADLVQGCIA